MSYSTSSEYENGSERFRKKWGWKYPDEEALKKAWAQHWFRMTAGVRKPQPKSPDRRSTQKERCDYCPYTKRLHEGKALYCPTGKNMREEPDERTRFGKRGRMERYAVYDKDDYIIGHVKARWVGDAQKRARKVYGKRASGVMVLNRKSKVGEPVFLGQVGQGPTKKMKHRAPWLPKKRKKAKTKWDACGFCGARMLGGKTDKRYGLLCPRCAKRVETARKQASDNKLGGDPRKPAYYVTARYIYKGKPQQFVFHVYAESTEDAKNIIRRRTPQGAVWIGITATRIKKGKAN